MGDRRLPPLILALALLTVPLAGCLEEPGTPSARVTPHDEAAPVVTMPDPGPGPTFNVTLREGPDGTCGVSPPSIKVLRGDNVHLRLRNEGTRPHNLTLGDLSGNVPIARSPGSLAPGASGGPEGWLNFTADVPSFLGYWCAVPDNEPNFQKGILSVGEPDEPSGVPPPLPPGGIDLQLTEDPGHNGTWVLSADYLTVTQGETLRLRLWNRGLPPHSFSIGAPYNVTSPLIPTGSAILFNFTATHTGTFVFNLGIRGHQSLDKTGSLDVRPAEGPSPVVRFDVELREQPGDHGVWSISPAVLSVAEGDLVRLRLHVDGTASHNLTIGGPYNLYSYGVLRHGDGDHHPSAWLNFTAAYAGEFQFGCAVPGHQGLGQHGRLVVTARSSP